MDLSKTECLNITARIVIKMCTTKTLANQSKTNTLFIFSTYKKKNKLVLHALLAFDTTVQPMLTSLRLF